MLETKKNKNIKVAIIGASGYTGVELIRLLQNHKHAQLTALVAGKNAGQEMSDLYSHLSGFPLPTLQKLDDTDFTKIDLVFCCLPHTTSQEIIKSLTATAIYSHLKIIDLSADFRLKNSDDYKTWYNNPHLAPQLQKNAVYGLSEFARNKIKKSSLIACPGCYPTSILLPLLPLVKAGLIETNNITIDSKSGISGAGRSLKTGNLFTEVNDGVQVYGVGNHRHIIEIEQELKSAANDDSLKISFTPHLVPMSRGIISTSYVTIEDGFAVDDLKNCLETTYEDEYFVNLTEDYPSTRDVTGSNLCKIAIFKSRIKNQAIIVSVIDNLVKGASGQAVQNMNILCGFDEKEGLESFPIYP